MHYLTSKCLNTSSELTGMSTPETSLSLFPCALGQVVTSLDEQWLAWMKEDCPLSLTWSCCKGAFHPMLFCAGFHGASDPRACFLELILPFTTAHLGQKATVLVSVACSFSRENSSSSSNPITFTPQSLTSPAFFLLLLTCAPEHLVETGAGCWGREAAAGHWLCQASYLVTLPSGEAWHGHGDTKTGSGSWGSAPSRGWPF